VDGQQMFHCTRRPAPPPEHEPPLPAQLARQEAATARQDVLTAWQRACEQLTFQRAQSAKLRTKVSPPPCFRICGPARLRQAPQLRSRLSRRRRLRHAPRLLGPAGAPLLLHHLVAQQGAGRAGKGALTSGQLPAGRQQGRRQRGRGVAEGEGGV
jgi:hypothetical protein